MRTRSIRLSILILLMLGISLAALGFKDFNIEIPGFPDVKRGGDGPLGLKLGLDLRGGGHLVYQADTGTNIVVAFTDPIRPGEVTEALKDLRFGEDEDSFPEFTVETRDANTVLIKTTTLLDDADPRRSEFKDTVEAKLGTIDDLRITTIDPPTSDQMKGVLDIINRRVNLFGTEEPIIQKFGDDRIIVQLPGASGSITEIQFRFDVEREALLAVVADNDLENLSISADDKRNYKISSDTLGAADQNDLRTSMEDRFGGIVSLRVTSGVEEAKSLTEVEFRNEIEQQDLLNLLTPSGLEDISIESDDNRYYKISSATLDTAKQEGLRKFMEDRFRAILSFKVASGIDEAKSLIGQTARLEFKKRTCSSPSCAQFIDDDIGLTGDDLNDAYSSADQRGVGWVVNLQFNRQGSDIFSELTEELFQEQDTKFIAVYLDDQPMRNAEGRDLAPRALAHIRDGRTQISGSFSREEARQYAIQFDSGRLPVPLKLIQEKDVDALLGAESLRNSLLAGFVGLGLVFAFMVAYYRMAGMVAAVALIFYAIVMMAVFKLIPITVTLSHVGGFILSVGMAVDANILIFERMKEELRIGRTLASSMEVGFNRAWPAIRDGNFSTLITCGVLLWVGDRLGGGLITGFAISLGIGVIVSIFTAVVVSRNLLQLLAWIGLGGRISLFTPEPRPGTQPAGGSS